MRLVAAGLSFRTAPLAVREAAAIPAARAATTLRYLVGHAGLHGAAVLSTCNRTDFYMVCPDNLAAEVTPRLARYLDPGGARDVERHMVTLEDREAALHMFRVASGLESMVIGEAQVLGQFKAAHRVATDAGTVDARLDYVMRRAISTAKRVRTDTALGQRGREPQRDRGRVRTRLVWRSRGQRRPPRGRRQDEPAGRGSTARRGGADHGHVAR